MLKAVTICVLGITTLGARQIFEDVPVADQEYMQSMHNLFQDVMHVDESTNLLQSELQSAVKKVKPEEFKSPRVEASAKKVPKVTVLSSGYDTGANLMITVNDRVVHVQEHDKGLRGISLVIVDLLTQEIEHAKAYDTYGLYEHERALFKKLWNLSNDKLVIMGVMDEGSYQLQQDTKDLITRLGSLHINELKNRHSWAFIGSTQWKIRPIE